MESVVAASHVKQLPAPAAVVWLIGVGLLVVMLEYAPKVGSALLAVIVVYLALQLPKKGL